MVILFINFVCILWLPSDCIEVVIVSWRYATFMMRRCPGHFISVSFTTINCFYFLEILLILLTRGFQRWNLAFNWRLDSFTHKCEDLETMIFLLCFVWLFIISFNSNTRIKFMFFIWIKWKKRKFIYEHSNLRLISKILITSLDFESVH